VLFTLWHDTAPRRAAWLGFVFGIGWFCAGVSWVYVSLHDVGGMPAAVAALAVLLFAVVLSAYTALAGWLQARLRAVPDLAHALLILPAAFTLTEWLRGWVFTGFPWIAPGYAHSDGPLAGYAALTGVHGLTFIACLAGSLVAQGFHGFSMRKPLARAVLLPTAGLVLLCAAGLGLRNVEWTQAINAPLSVSLVQGNIPQELKFVPGRFESTLSDYAAQIEANPADLIVLPETALPRMLHTLPREYLLNLDRFASARGATLITGVPRAEAANAGTNPGNARYFNSAITLGRDSGQGYDKSHLVPFGEFIPFGFRWFVALMNMPLGDFTSGADRQSPLRIGPQRIAINICYEDLFGEEIIRQLPQATLLLNLSNVAWFGDSLAPHQHLQASRMRAMETGRVMLRATNSGATAVIDHQGRVTRRLPFFTTGVLTASVQGRSGATPFTLTGNWPVITLCVCVLLCATWLARRARSARRLH
jgi:apolipoprotein N-acyltransferase